MRNSMQDLDFEQTAMTGPIQDYEFTRRAARRFREVVSLESFEDEDAETIFHYLYKEMELVSFGDYLKRYIYERAGLQEPFQEVPQEVYREIMIDSFKETCTPKSMTPTSTKLTSLTANWLNQASVKRETVFLLGFALRMTVEDVSDFLTRVLREQDFDLLNAEEVIYWYCYVHQLGYYKAEELKNAYQSLKPSEEKSAFEGWKEPENEQELLAYLSRLKAPDVEKVICSGIPINKMGNLKKMSASTLARHFSQKRFSRQRITNILNHKFPVERFDLITLEFFIVSQEDVEDPYIRYRHFLDEIQEILKRCQMGEIYIVNPYECFILMCLLTECPLAVFSEIWEKSYEETEQ